MGRMESLRINVLCFDISWIPDITWHIANRTTVYAEEYIFPLNTLPDD